MAPSTARSSSVICAENIALLHLLHPIPSLPSSNEPVATAPSPRQARALSLSNERSLAGVLALLCSRTDDPNCVSAVAIQESLDARSLTVFVAVNQARGTASNSYLYGIQQSLQQVFDALAQVTQGQPEQSRAVYTAVVNSVKPRILCRLRYSGRKKSRTPLHQLLEKTTEILRRSPQKFESTGLARERNEFLTASKPLRDALTAYRLHQTTERLLTLIERAHQWAETVTDFLPTLADKVGDQINSAEPRELLQTFRKVGQYYRAARYLYRKAKKFEIVRNMTAFPIQPKQGSFLPTMNTNFHQLDIDLWRTLERVCQGSTKFETFRKLDLYASEKISSGEALSKFREAVLDILKNSRIHAEVQIVAHLESCAEEGLRPRIIRSNKKACYLCNQLLKTHKVYFTPHSHERIYTGWCLPILPEISRLQDAFNATLERQARLGIEKLLSTRKAIKYPYPHESSCISATNSLSTVPEMPEDQAPAMVLTPVETTVASASPASETQGKTYTEHRNEITALSSSSSSVISEASPASQSRELNNELTSASPQTCSTPQQVPEGTTMLAFANEGIECHLEYTINGKSPARGEHLRFSTKLLEVGEKTATHADHAGRIHNIALMDKGAEVTVPHCDVLFLETRENMLRLIIHE